MGCVIALGQTWKYHIILFKILMLLLFANTVWPWTGCHNIRSKLMDRVVDLSYSRSRLLSDSGSENARLDSVGPPFTLSRRERTLFCRFLANRARRIFHIAASLRLATFVRTAVMAVKRKITNLNKSTDIYVTLGNSFGAGSVSGVGVKIWMGT